jgi:hypothetical protein
MSASDMDLQHGWRLLQFLRISTPICPQLDLFSLVDWLQRQQQIVSLLPSSASEQKKFDLSPFREVLTS